MRVSNIKKGEAFTVYCGRENKWVNLPQSFWANPFIMKKESQRKLVVCKYIKHLLRTDRKILQEELAKLKDEDVLGCWCKPKLCHCDVIVALKGVDLNLSNVILYKLIYEEIFK